MRETYRIVRFFMNHPSETLQEGLSLEEVQEHCRDPETSYKTCTSSVGKSRTEKYGPWFDGYQEE